MIVLFLLVQLMATGDTPHWSSPMEAREQRGLVIAATCKITKERRITDQRFWVPSSSQDGKKYKVIVAGECQTCTCPDFEERQATCKHIFAVRFVIKRERNADGTTTVTESVTVSETVEKRKIYPRDWVAYNAAQTTEKDWFLTLLADLCRDIPQPERKPTRGTRPMLVSDGIFSACYKVFSGFSARRFTCDLEDAADAGLITRAVHFNRVLQVLEEESTTPILYDLIRKSATPLRAVETEWAVDSSGFSGCRFDKWFDKKYGVPKRESAWTKAHIICGTRTNVIAAAEILGNEAADSPRLPGLVATAAKTFTISEVAVDKAYPGVDNFNAVDAVGGKLYAAFKSNTTGAVGGIFGKMYHLFCLDKEAYLAHYHRRSMVETTFSMVKRKFGDSVRAKTDTAMRNEVLAKFVCHNIACVVSAIYERGIDPKFVGLSPVAVSEGPRDVLPLLAP